MRQWQTSPKRHLLEGDLDKLVRRAWRQRCTSLQPLGLAWEPFPPASDSSRVISMQIMGAVQEYLENGIVQNVELALNFTDCFCAF